MSLLLQQWIEFKELFDDVCRRRVCGAEEDCSGAQIPATGEEGAEATGTKCAQAAEHLCRGWRGSYCHKTRVKSGLW